MSRKAMILPSHTVYAKLKGPLVLQKRQTSYVMAIQSKRKRLFKKLNLSIRMKK
jgi:hypothetical protein